MNPTVKHFLINFAKNAVNAALVTVMPMLTDPKDFHFHDRAGWLHMASLIGGAVFAREVMVYGPKLIAWSQSTNGTPVQ